MMRSSVLSRRERGTAPGANRLPRQDGNVVPLTEKVKAALQLQTLLAKALADGRRSATQRGIPKAARPARLREMEGSLKRALEESQRDAQVAEESRAGVSPSNPSAQPTQEAR